MPVRHGREGSHLPAAARDHEERQVRVRLMYFFGEFPDSLPVDARPYLDDDARFTRSGGCISLLDHHFSRGAGRRRALCFLRVREPLRDVFERRPQLRLERGGARRSIDARPQFLLLFL